MKKQMIFMMWILAFGLVSCQGGSLFAEPTPITIPTRLVLPTPTVTDQPQAANPKSSIEIQPSPTFIEPSPIPPTLEPSPAPTRIGVYTGMAKGIELNEQSGRVDPTRLKADFGVVIGGKGWDAFNYKTNLQVLYDANLPCLYLWDILIPDDFDASKPDRSFPPENEEPNVDAIMRSVGDKPIDGIIIRFLDKDMPDGRVFTEGWMANYIQWIIKAVAHQTGKPVFVMTSKAFILGFGEAPTLYKIMSETEGMSSWKAAYDEKETRPASWNDFPFPPDDYKPEYIPGNYALTFINFSRSAWKLEGIDAASTPLWLYTGSAAELKKILDYKDHAPVVR